MPFSFLNPWLLIGALTLAVPIWLHLRRKQVTNLHLFPTLRFLDDQPEPRRAPLRLRDILLFMCRALALVMLVGAFAWPYLRRADTVPVKESRVYILDNTLSHQADNGFGKDRDQLLGEISSAQLDTQFAVVEVAAVPRVIVGFADDRESAKQKIRQLQPSFQRGSYLAAFRQAGALLRTALGEQKRIILLGDNQENQWTENANTPPFLQDVRVDLPKPSFQSLPNISLSEPRAQRIFLGDKSLVNFTVKLTHTGGARSAGAVLRADGKIIFDRQVDLDKQPETFLLQAQWEADPSSWLRGDVEVSGSPDALAGDNKAFFALPPLAEGKVALLALSPYLRLALSPEIMRGQWATRVLDPSNLSSELSSGQDDDVLCLESNYLQASDTRKLVQKYLSNGRGVVLLVNRVTPAVSGALRELGFEVDGDVDALESLGRAEKFQFVAFNHPIFHPFLSPDYGNLMEIKVSKYVRFKDAQAMPLIFSEKGAGLLFESVKGQGRIFVAAFGLDREHTSWPVHASFIPFLDLTLQAARAQDLNPTVFEPAETALVQIPGGMGAREVVLRDGDREIARARVDGSRAEVQLPDKPGLYNLTYDEKTRVEQVFGVNPSPKESQLVFVDTPEAINLWRVEGTAGKSALASPAVPMSTRAILQQRLWWWMLTAGLGALGLEMAMAAMRPKNADV